jgi:hypothetical protein
LLRNNRANENQIILLLRNDRANENQIILLLRNNRENESLFVAKSADSEIFVPLQGIDKNKYSLLKLYAY